jgi:hypothetical protein
MKILAHLVINLLFLLILSVPNAFSGSCTECPPPANSSSPGGGHPDESYAVDSGFLSKGQVLFSDPSIVSFQNGFFKELTSLVKSLKKAESKTDARFTALQLLHSTPLLVVPSGGLYGYENSAMLKASLDEYVKQSGTLVVLSQKHGYDYASIPTPDGKPITGYGWEEDQNCFADSVAIESWHQLLSGQLRSTPTLNVDGYFTGYPANSTILLRRTANGQPAMLMYEHGAGRVIVTSMYSDWAYGHGQASQEEIALVRDLLSWAKKAAALPEIKPGETISVPVTLTNSTTTDAATVKLQIWNPDRSTLLLEQAVNTSIPAGQSTVNNVTWQAPSNGALGIHHIDYILLDATGAVIQPQAETDSGRFVVSSPPQTGFLKKDIWLSITSPNQEVFFNEPFLYTFHIFNNSPTTRNLTLKSWLPHTNRWHEWPVTAIANGETVINGSDLFIDSRYMFETLRAYLYDENNVQIGSYMLSFKGVYPSVDVTTTSGKGGYTKGETVALSVSLKNGRSVATAAKLGVMVTDPANSAVYTTTKDLTLDASGTAILPFSFTLPAIAQGGVYAVATEVMDASGKKIGGDAVSFELPLSQVAVVPAIPAVLATGSNNVTFNLTNNGKLSINSGSLDLSLLEPGGSAVADVSQPFTLDPAQVKSVALPLTVPPLKFGIYTLVYAQNDETKTGKPATVTLTNAAAITTTFDKPSHRIRETANLTVSLANTGRFNLENAVVTVTAPDAGFTETRTVTIGQGQSLALQYALLLPATMTAGQHAVTITMTLPSGSSATRSTTITVPQPSLVISYGGPGTVNAGDALTLIIENSGGLDTGYNSGSVTIMDNKGVQLYQGNPAGAILAGEKKPLVAIAIPGQTASGSVFLNSQVKDSITGNIATYYKSLTIAGVKVTMQAGTDQLSYPLTGRVTGNASIANNGSALEGGSLKVTVRNGGSAIPLNGLRLWLKSDSGVSKDASGFVSWWADQSGNNFNVTQGNYLKQPRLVDSAVNGKPVIRFDGSNDFIQTATSVNLLNNTGNFSLFVVVKPGTTQKTYADIVDYQHNQWGSLLLQQDGSVTNKYYVGGPNCSTNGNCPSAQILTPTRYQLYSAVFQQNTFGYTFLNGENRKTQGAFSSVFSDPRYFAVGGKALEAEQRQFNGDIAEVIIYNRGLLDSDRIAVERQLISKYAIDAVPSQTNDTLYEAVIPVTQAANTTSSYSADIGLLNVTGKLYLDTELKNSLGQVVSATESPFYIVQGSFLMSFNTNKKLYKTGETVTVTGEVRNLSAAPAANLSLALKTKDAAKIIQTIYTENMTIPAGGGQPFSVTTTAGSEGIVTLTGILTQSGSTLAEIADQYEVAAPKVTATLMAPDLAGNDSFSVSLSLANGGKTEAIVAIAKSFDPLPETVTIPAGESRLLQYQQQIGVTTPLTFTISGDLNQSVTKTIQYGLAGSVNIAPLSIYPEGKITIPATISNNGLLDGQFGVAWQLSQGSSVVAQQSSGYYLQKGGSARENLAFDLSEGSYQLTATGQLPVLAASGTFTVRKDLKVDLNQTVGAQNGLQLPVTVNVSNLGFSPVSGVVRLSLIDNGGTIAWSTSRDLSLPFAMIPVPQPQAFSINLSTLKPGSYTVKAELLDAGNRQLAFQAAPFSLLGPTFAITQLPLYRIIPSGGSSDFTFKVKNNGNQEGKFALHFKADDLIDSVRSEWLKPGEEKEIAFALQAASDLDEKDYFASYGLKTGTGTVDSGVVKYRLTGINIAVEVSLNRQAYTPGETATLSLNVTQQDKGAAPSLFARVNYNGYNEKQAFTLNGSQTLVFNVPLTQITGEKLFYGIYAESGRSIHLNTIYLRKADSELAISTGKQVYNPGETVTATISGSAAGNLTLTGPGGFATTFAYSGSATRSFSLPATMTAGTYTLNAQLTTQDSKLITVSYPFDVSGIQVKVKEALLDRAKYAATDTMQLSLAIESNQNLASIVRTWVVDPAGNYTQAGEAVVNLTASAPLLSTLNSRLSTVSLGIHKLVYGIYQGDILLASGAKAFDIGDAVLLALSTDKTDYPANTVPVAMKVDMSGTTFASLELLLDGISIKTDAVNLNGFSTNPYTLLPGSITPGLHKLKAVLTAGGLTSVKETSFAYGSSLPDLTARLTAGAAKGAKVTLTCTVTNQGKTVAGANTLTFYDGDPAYGGMAIASLNVPQLDPGASATLNYDWNVLGKAGDHVAYAIADSSNVVVEFNKVNNTALYPVSLPKLTLSVTTGKPSYKANEEVGVTLSLANLTANVSYSNTRLLVELTGSAGEKTILIDKSIATLSPAAETITITGWNTRSSVPGDYTLTARLTTDGVELASSTANFTIESTPSVAAGFTLSAPEVIQGFPLTIACALTNNGNIDLPVGGVTAELIDKNSGITVKEFSQPFPSIAVLQNLSQELAIEKVEVQPGDYTVRVTALAAEITFPIGEKSLKVLPPIEVTKGLSLAPRVLVFLGKGVRGIDDGEDKNEHEDDKEKRLILAETTIRQALDGMGAYYAIVRDAKEFRAGLRSGLYNIHLLAGSKPLPDHLDAELAERINSGDGLVLSNYEKLEDEKFRGLAGVKRDGQLASKPRLLTLLDSPMTHSGSYQLTGRVQKLRVISANTQIAAVMGDKGGSYPALVLNPFGEGKVAVFAFTPDATLLQSAVGYTAPARVDVIPAVPLPVEVSLKSLGTQFDLKVSETVDTALPILLTYPLGTIDQQKITWQFSLGSSETRKLSYLAGLPEETGSYDLFSEVSYLKNGNYESYKTYPLTVKPEKGLIALKTGILINLRSLAVTGTDAARLNKIIGAYAKVIDKPVFTAEQVDEAIKEFLELTEELRNLKVDTTLVRLDLDRLLRIYGRKWSDLQFKGTND